MTNKIGDIRRSKNITQRALAAHLHRHRSTISRLESGKLPLTLDDTRRIAAFLDVQPGELVCGLEIVAPTCPILLVYCDCGEAVLLPCTCTRPHRRRTIPACGVCTATGGQPIMEEEAL